MRVSRPPCRQVVSVAHRESRAKPRRRIAAERQRASDEVFGSRQHRSDLVLDRGLIGPIIVAEIETGQWPISTRVNKPENDDPTIVDPVELTA
jgi:hypothetical protein